ncbi:MAG: DNA methylase [Verrucomicrobia bacterium]|nr:DNA methylase [Verrucomicrobiota bacterium]
MNKTDLNIERKLIADLMPAPYNPREISPEALAGLQASVARFGLVEPVVWNRRTGHVVGGHQRLKALAALGETATQVVVVDLDEIEEKALNVALNSPSIAGEFTVELHALLAEIEAALPDLADELLFGDLAEQMKHLLADLTPEDGLTDPDDVPDPPETPITNPGDLWVLGAHRLICGDGADPAVLARLMDGAKAALYNTDPPYGVGYDSTNHPQNSSDKAKGRKAGSQNKDWSGDYDDLDAWDHFGDRAEFEAFLTGVFKAALPHVEQKAAWYCWHASATADCFRRAWDAVGIRYHQTIVWVKPTFVLGFAMWNYRNEPCLMGWKQGHKPEAMPVEDEHSNVWECGWEGGKARCTDNLHPTQKPTRLFELPMLKHTRPGAICLESFSGSGSQIIAAERLGRRCFAVEINPRFVDVAVLRWEQFTGQTAVRVTGAVA